MATPASRAFFRPSARGDAVIATGWQTVARAAHATGFRQRFYLVQDYEPDFHPAGSHALAAIWTYTQDFACICASPWLAQMLQQKHKRWTRYFWLACDKTIYHPCSASAGRNNGEGKPSRIAVYARAAAPRRVPELALLALEYLAAKGVEFLVDLFGDEIAQAQAPFPCTSHGVLDAPQLAELYRQADIGICFSATNYSLVPQEMMACGLPVVELDGDSTRAIFPDGVVTLAPPHPISIAAAIETLLKDHDRRSRQAEAGLRWTAQFNWEKSAGAVERALLERLITTERQKTIGSKKSARPRIKASVCIPTYNAGQLLRDVVERVRLQRTPWPFEVIIIDSDSTDGSVDGLSFPGGPELRIKTIAKMEFQHGRTRNLCATLSRGEFVAFLTQDAMPADEFWLYNLITVLARFPRAAGAFGRHLPWPNSDPFTRRDITDHFNKLLQYPLVLSRETNPERWNGGDTAWRQVLHYYSDNNSCLRKSVWVKHPYPEVDYGEDQLWADRIITAGYEKVYVPSAAVYHSHDYTTSEVAERAETEAHFFATKFGYEVYDYGASFNEQLTHLDDADRRWAMANNVSEQDLSRRLLVNRASLYGRGRGVRRALDESSAANLRRLGPVTDAERRLPPRREARAARVSATCGPGSGQQGHPGNTPRR
jgi:glycosyltransferase involved in cell wall biosynthesis